MSTLAQDLLDCHGHVKIGATSEALAAVDLKQHYEFITYLREPVHPFTTPWADRYFMDKSVWFSVRDMTQTAESVDALWPYAKPSGTGPTWIEMDIPEEDSEHCGTVRFGAFISSCEIDNKPGVPHLLMIMYVQVPETKTPTMLIRCVVDMETQQFGIMPKPMIDTDMAHRCAMLFVGALALLNIPGATTRDTKRWDTKLQKARAKAKKQPMLSHNTVTMVVPKEYTVPGYDAPYSLGAVNRKRRHHVSGHLRRKDPEDPSKGHSWVTPHWRGDASLGLKLTSHNVTMKKDKQSATD